MANDIISDVSNHVAEAQSSSEATDTVKKRGSGGSLGDKMGLEVLELTVDRAVATMPVEGNTQPMGIMHGGAYVVLGESLGSMSASLHAGPGRFAVGVDINATHHRPVMSGTVTAVATPIAVGRTTASIEIVLTDEEGRRTCTCRFRPAPTAYWPP